MPTADRLAAPAAPEETIVASQPDTPADILARAIADEKVHLSGYSPGSQAITLELVRALDRLFMSEVVEPKPHGVEERLHRRIMEWGMNEALLRALPPSLSDAPFKLFPSTPERQDQVDEFLFRCGTLTLAEQMAEWLREGLVSAEYRRHESEDRPVLRALVLRTADPSLGDEVIGRSGLAWESSLKTLRNRARERELALRHREVERELESRCVLLDGFVPFCPIDEPLCDFFEECAAVYLDRIFAQDMLGPDDRIGGFPFRDYLDTVRVLSGRQHRHLAMLRVLRRRHPEADLRNLLTHQAQAEELHAYVALRRGISPEIAERLLEPLTLSPGNLELHLRSRDPVWPSLIRTNKGTYIEPLFGLDINPYLFLAKSLRGAFEDEWSVLANRRERRWIEEMESLFAGSRLQTVARSTMLRQDGRDVTDIDFTAYDGQNGDLLLFQLKWQQPVGADDAARRSMGSNLIRTGNKWVAAVEGWIAEHGISELMRRLGLKISAEPRIRLFVVARYNAHFGGRSGRDDRAVWTSWAHFRKAWQHRSKRPTKDLVNFLRRQATEAKRRSGERTLTFPINDVTVLLNPRKVPKR